MPPRDDLPVAVTKTISSWGVPETAAAACNPGFLYPGMPRNRQSISHVLSPVRPSISQERLGFDHVCRLRGLCMMPSLETKSLHFARPVCQCWICEDKEPGRGAVHTVASVRICHSQGARKLQTLNEAPKRISPRHAVYIRTLTKSFLSLGIDVLYFIASSSMVTTPWPIERSVPFAWLHEEHLFVIINGAWFLRIHVQTELHCSQHP